MTIKLEIPDFDGNAIDVVWEENSQYIVEVHNQEIVLKANSRGLISLAKQMVYMAINHLPTGSHIHYNDFLINQTQCDYGLTIEKIQEQRKQTGDDPLS